MFGQAWTQLLIWDWKLEVVGIWTFSLTLHVVVKYTIILSYTEYVAE